MDNSLVSFLNIFRQRRRQTLSRCLLFRSYDPDGVNPLNSPLLGRRMSGGEIDSLRVFFLKCWLVRQWRSQPCCGEVAQKAIKEIATVPPRLLFYSILGAVGLVLSGCARNVVALAI